MHEVSHALPVKESMKGDFHRITVTLTDLPPLLQLEGLWRDLAPRANGSFFTSWPWVGAWLSTYGANLQAESSGRLLMAKQGPRVLGLGIVCRTLQHGLLRRVVVLLNQTGRLDDDSAFIEYNGFLLDQDEAHETQSEILKFICHSDDFVRGPWAWKKFEIAATREVLLRSIYDSSAKFRITRQSDCPWVDLKKLPSEKGAYLSNLSANTRGQIRRGIRLAERDGPISISVAQSKPEAHSFFNEMKQLHLDTWRRRNGSCGAFSFPAFAKFAAALIDMGMDAGSVELLRVSAGSTTIGVLLNFTHDGHAYAYQSGFAYHNDNRKKPGLICHVSAVNHYKSRNFAGYHFMAGEGRYKASLGMAVEKLTWISLRRDDFWSRLEDAARAFKIRFSRSHSLKEHKK